MNRQSYPFKTLPSPERKPIQGVFTIIVLLLIVIGIPVCLAVFFVEGDLAHRIFMYSQFLGIVLLLLSPIVYRIAKAGGGRLARDAFTILERDPRPPVLLLRSFGDDLLLDVGVTDPKLYGSLTQEIKLVGVLNKIGPVIAIGRPGEKFPTLGAARFYVPDDQWRIAVEYFMQQSAVVVFIMGQSPGVLWEVETALRICPIEKLLFFFPYPVKREKISNIGDYVNEVGRNPSNDELRILQQDRQERYDRLRGAVKKVWNVELPVQLGQSVFLHFIARGEPRLLRYRKPVVLMAAEQSRDTHFDIRRTLLPFLEKISVQKWEPSRIERFYGNKNALKTAFAIILLSTISFYVFTGDMAWDAPGSTLIFILRLILWILVLFLLYHLWINIRYHDVG